MKKTNIIFLLQDQMQQQIIEESSGCLMPNLHCLMQDGLNFERAYTCNAICSPSRASLLTGTLPHTHGMVDCTHTVPPYRAKFDDTLDTLTGVLQKEGYHISYHGKWHIERSHQLEKFGIEEYETEQSLPQRKVSVKEKVMMSAPGYADKMICGVFDEDSSHTEEHYIYGKATDFIERHRQGDAPWCSFISTYAPHDPYCVPREVYDLYDGIDLPLPENFYDSLQDRPAIYRRMKEALACVSEDDFHMIMRCYYSYCTLVDLQIGKLVAYLKENNLYDDTLIVCLSDHGDMMGAHGMLTKSVPSFEEIYHIPLVMKLPQNKDAGAHPNFYINTYEIAPTVLELVGCPALQGDYIGQSMTPWMNGAQTDSHYAYAEFFGQRFAYTQRILWMDSLKYVFNAFDYDELYDLEKDPHELTNLQAHPDYQEAKRLLCQKMWECISQTGDSTLEDAQYYLLRIAPTGPGPKQSSAAFSIYNKSF